MKKAILIFIGGLCILAVGATRGSSDSSDSDSDSSASNENNQRQKSNSPQHHRNSPAYYPQPVYPPYPYGGYNYPGAYGPIAPYHLPGNAIQNAFLPNGPIGQARFLPQLPNQPFPDQPIGKSIIAHSLKVNKEYKEVGQHSDDSSD